MEACADGIAEPPAHGLVAGAPGLLAEPPGLLVHPPGRLGAGSFAAEGRAARLARLMRLVPLFMRLVPLFMRPVPLLTRPVPLLTRPVPLLAVHKQLAPNHYVVLVALANGEVLEMSPQHPTADGH